MNNASLVTTLDVLKTLRTLLPDAPSGQAERLFSMVSLRGLLQHPWVSLCLANASVSMAHTPLRLLQLLPLHAGYTASNHVKRCSFFGRHYQQQRLNRLAVPDFSQ